MKQTYSSRNKLSKPIFDKNEAFIKLKVAVTNGNARQVALYLSNKEWPLVDPLADAGYPDEDGYNPTIVYDLLYIAAPNPAVLELLLRDGRLDPNGVSQSAFYRCLLSGSIEGVDKFVKDGRINIPKDALAKAAQTGSKKIVEYLLRQDALADYQLFDQNAREEALKISISNDDKEIISLLHDYIDNSHYVSHSTQFNPF